MILLKCPNCGERNVTEFRYGGEARSRPDPEVVGPAEWSAYLHLRANPSGPLREWWYHRAGCGCWFLAERHTKSHAIAATWLASGEEPTA